MIEKVHFIVLKGRDVWIICLYTMGRCVSVIPHLLGHSLNGFNEELIAYNVAGKERQDFLAETGTVGDRHLRITCQTWRKEQMSGLKER